MRKIVTYHFDKCYGMRCFPKRPIPEPGDWIPTSKRALSEVKQLIAGFLMHYSFPWDSNILKL